MRTKNHELMDRIVEYVDDYYKLNGRSPYTTEIAVALGVNKSQVHRYLVDLDGKGIIEYRRSSIKTPNMLKIVPANYTGIVGSIPCGRPDEPITEPIEEYVGLPVSIFGHGELYILRACGESMIDAGIDDGDLVVVRRTDYADVGEIVAARTREDECTLKRIAMRNGKRVLHPENKDMADILVPFSVQGIAVYVLKKIGKVV